MCSLASSHSPRFPGLALISSDCLLVTHLYSAIPISLSHFSLSPSHPHNIIFSSILQISDQLSDQNNTYQFVDLAQSAKDNAIEGEVAQRSLIICTVQTQVYFMLVFLRSILCHSRDSAFRTKATCRTCHTSVDRTNRPIPTLATSCSPSASTHE